MTSEILLCIIKLVAGGIVTFLSILLMSKTRDASWMLLVCGFLLFYAAQIFEILIQLGVFAQLSITVLGIPLTALLCTVLPSLFFIVAFILMLARK